MSNREYWLNINFFETYKKTIYNSLNINNVNSFMFDFFYNFYINVNFKNWIILIITTNFKIIIFKKKIRLIIKRAMKRKNIINTNSNTFQNKLKLVEILKNIKIIFSNIFRHFISKRWFRKYELNMTKKINNIYKHCRNKKQKITIFVNQKIVKIFSTRWLFFEKIDIIIRSIAREKNTFFIR